jgi:hypothetical protein
VRELVRKQMDENWKDWPRKNLEVIGNKTPLQAAKTADGREMLEAMLLQMERDDEQTQPSMRQKEYIDQARRELGLG